MGRLSRFIPENDDGVAVEVTGRVIGGRAMLVPAPNTRLFNEVVVGVMGRALEISPLELCSAVWTANHFHLIAVVHEQQQLSRFMQHLACNISKGIGGRMRAWRGSFWERRYDGIVISDEPEVQWARLKYSLSHGVKEQLVASPEDWPGVHSAAALVHGAPLEGCVVPPHSPQGDARWNRSPRPSFHVKEPKVKEDLRDQLKAFLARYWEASEALRSGNLEAAEWFPDGCYPPALPFVGNPPPPRLPSPPTRSITVLESGVVERGEFPVVEIPVRVWSVAPEAETTWQAVEPRARGQPP